MNRVEMLKLAYARGAFLALREAGYQEKVAEDLAIKIADRDALDVLEDVGIGAGIGGLGGAALGSGAGALSSKLMGGRNLMTEMPFLGTAAPGVGTAMSNPGALAARLHANDLMKRMKGETLRTLLENPAMSSAAFGGTLGGGAGMAAGGLAGGLGGE